MACSLGQTTQACHANYVLIKQKTTGTDTYYLIMACFSTKLIKCSTNKTAQHKTINKNSSNIYVSRSSSNHKYICSCTCQLHSNEKAQERCVLHCRARLTSAKTSISSRMLHKDLGLGYSGRMCIYFKVFISITFKEKCFKCYPVSPKSIYLVG